MFRLPLQAVFGDSGSGHAVQHLRGVGFIPLFGIAVPNGIVLLTYIIEIYKSGVPLGEAVEQGAGTGFGLC